MHSSKNIGKLKGLSGNLELTFGKRLLIVMQLSLKVFFLCNLVKKTKTQQSQSQSKHLYLFAAELKSF